MFLRFFLLVFKVASVYCNFHHIFLSFSLKPKKKNKLKNAEKNYVKKTFLLPCPVHNLAKHYKFAYEQITKYPYHHRPLLAIQLYSYDFERIRNKMYPGLKIEIVKKGRVIWSEKYKNENKH